jgi:hypothetical protein
VLVPGSYNAPEPATSAELAEEIVACAERTLMVRGARIKFCRDSNFSWPERWRRRRGGLVDPVAGLAKLAIKEAWKKWAPHDVSFSHLVAEGLIEPAAARYMLDYGAYAELFDGERFFGGRSGRALETLEPWPRSLKRPDPYWMLAALRGANTARHQATECLRGAMCRKLESQVDLERASKGSVAGLHTPAAARFEDLHSVPLTVWLDQEHIRRVAYQESPYSTLTLELWDFGISIAELDWMRLPIFKPGEQPDT